MHGRGNEGARERGEGDTGEGDGDAGKGPAGEERFALSRVSRVARALGGSWWPFRLPGQQG